MLGDDTTSLAPDPSSGLRKDKAGMLQQDGAEPPVLDKTLGTWGQSLVFAPALINLTTTHPPPRNALLATPGKNPISTGNVSTHINLIK